MQNTLYTHDNLYVLNGLNSEIADLIYLDPPFNSNRIYSAPVGSKAAGTSFKDMWTWSDISEDYLEKLTSEHPFLVKFIQSIEGLHSKAMMAYVLYMAQRILEMHRILKPTGSIYLHCDQTASHYLKLLMDEIFGKKHFCTEIIWSYSWGVRTKKRWNRKHDVILMYTKTEDYFFDADEVLEPRRLQEQSKKRLEYSGAMIKDYNKRGDSELALPTDVWLIPTINAMSKERTGYPTQKPLALLDRIIKASCPKGGLVLDPFCGCATTCVSAQNLGRKWIGIDIETKAVEILLERLTDLWSIKDLNFIHRTDAPQRTDVVIEPITPETKNDIKKRLFKKQAGHCNGCTLAFNIQNFEIDHIIPRAKGGGDYIENYQLLCGSCNKIKGARPMEYLRMKIRVREDILREKITFGE